MHPASERPDTASKAMSARMLAVARVPSESDASHGVVYANESGLRTRLLCWTDVARRRIGREALGEVGHEIRRLVAAVEGVVIVVLVHRRPVGAPGHPHHR